MAVTSEEETGGTSVRKLEGMVHKLSGEVQAIQKQIVGTDQNVHGREMKQPRDRYGQELGADMEGMKVAEACGNHFHK